MVMLQNQIALRKGQKSGNGLIVAGNSRGNGMLSSLAGLYLGNKMLNRPRPRQGQGVFGDAFKKLKPIGSAIGKTVGPILLNTLGSVLQSTINKKLGNGKKRVVKRKTKRR
jgi:hypothetical protein